MTTQQREHTFPAHFAIHQLPDGCVVSKENNVSAVQENADKAFPPLDDFVSEESEERSNGGNIEGEIPDEGLPVKVERFPGADCRHPYDDQDVKNRRPNNRPYAKVPRGIGIGK